MYLRLLCQVFWLSNLIYRHQVMRIQSALKNSELFIIKPNPITICTFIYNDVFTFICDHYDVTIWTCKCFFFLEPCTMRK